MLKKSCMSEEPDERLVPEKIHHRNLEKGCVISCNASNQQDGSLQQLIALIALPKKA
jgi:hypothetical protein